MCLREFNKKIRVSFHIEQFTWNKKHFILIRGTYTDLVFSLCWRGPSTINAVLWGITFIRKKEEKIFWEDVASLSYRRKGSQPSKWVFAYMWIPSVWEKEPFKLFMVKHQLCFWFTVFNPSHTNAFVRLIGKVKLKDINTTPNFLFLASTDINLLCQIATNDSKHCFSIFVFISSWNNK